MLSTSQQYRVHSFSSKHKQTSFFLRQLSLADRHPKSRQLALQESLKDISARLKHFRPAATVLETEVAPARRGEGAGAMSGPGMTASSYPSDFQEVMKQKRKHHGDAIKVRLSKINCNSFNPH